MADGTQEKLGEIYVQVSADVKKLNSEIQSLKTQLGKDGEQAGKSFATKFGSHFGKFLVATGAITVLSRILKKSVESFAAQELAETKLRTALGKTSQALLDQANALQKVTIYSDDSVINAQARIAAYTQDEEQVKKLTKATLDLAAGLGTDLEGASQLVAKTFGTSTNALMRQGVEVNGLAGSTERLHSIVQGITDLYGGQAENQAKTFSGRLGSGVFESLTPVESITVPIASKRAVPPLGI
jgi:RNA binding exosome subunit